ncbi:MAG TPA: acyltransferase [Bryocella sp.]|nr:acyltransferase [Bryocella sp.]
MPVYDYRDLRPTPDAEHLFTEWLASLDAAFTRDTTYEARSEIVRETLRTILPQSASTIVRASHDPRNITLEPEYYGDMDPARYYPRKPLIWLWLQFDASPLGANQWLGERLRNMLGRHIFARIGQRVRIFQNVTFSYGYNLEIGDDCWIHRHVLLDDRGGSTLHDGCSISDYANIYSHTHDLVDQRNVSNLRTEIGPRTRITYHATVLAGTKVGPDAMLGALGLATRDIPAHTISLGIPAKPKLTK